MKIRAAPVAQCGPQLKIELDDETEKIESHVCSCNSVILCYRCLLVSINIYEFECHYDDIALIISVI